MKFNAGNICTLAFFWISTISAAAGSAGGVPASSVPMVDNGTASYSPSRPPAPHVPSALPRSYDEWKYDLSPSNKPRLDLMTPEMRQRMLVQQHSQSSRAADCDNMDQLASYTGAALANYVANLPDSECANQLFSVTPAQSAKIYTADNLNAIAARYVAEASIYNSTNGALLNLTLFLRATYYLADNGNAVTVSPEILTIVRPAIMQLVSGPVLFTPNNAASTTAGEVVTLITNMHDEVSYLDVMKQLVAYFTNSQANPSAALALDDPNVGGGFTGILKVFYYSHYRSDAILKIEKDPSYADTLYAFVKANKASLLNDPAASYQLNQAATEAFRFAMHPALLPIVSVMIKDTLASSMMTGPDNLLWLAAALAVENYDNANCSQYNTCNFEGPLAAAVLANNYSCPTGVVRLRTQELTPDQASQACMLIANETPYFHAMMHASNVPVANDYNKTLEVVVFSSNTDYQNYSGVIFGNDTNNGGIYLEGNPNSPSNQARFIAYEATWLRPTFEVWNLKHEYVHYLDGRFDMYGDFNYENKLPVVWYEEGLAEYISLKNDNQTAIDAAKTGQYLLSDIFKNTYDMADYENRAYAWGYMSVRFVFERHPEILSTILPKFRVGDYAGYWAYMTQLSTQFDQEFASWVQTVTTSGTPTPPR